MKILRPEVLDQPMTRAEFLKNLGIGTVLLMGGGIFLQWLGHTQDTTTNSSPRAYGINTYGGKGKQISLQ